MNTYNLYTSMRILFFLMVAIGLVACNVSETQNIERVDWQLVWSDDFDGAAGTSPSETNWNYDIGRGQDGWGNQELQSYTNDPQNIALDGNGNLIITARKLGDTFSSARINTKGKFAQTYGRFEARLKTPYGPGLWPAFWMLGSDIDEVSWPQAGEIDIMELRGQLPHIISGSVHGPGYSAAGAVSKSYGLQNGRFDADFHVLAAEWFPDRIDFFVDDFLYQRITKDQIEEAGNEWVFNKDFYLLLNVAVGGSYVGFPSADTPFPQQMVIDYVKVYRAP